MQRQQHHHRPDGLPPPAVQVAATAQSHCLNLGEHADRAQTDHDLAGREDDGGNLDPTPGEADVKRLSPARLTAGYAQNFWIGA